MSIIATCVVLALFLYIERRRPWAAKARAESFKGRYRLSSASNFHADFRASMLTALRNGSDASISNPDHTPSSNTDHNGAQIEPEMQEGAQTRANPSEWTTSCSSDSNALNLRQFSAEKVRWRPRNPP